MRALLAVAVLCVSIPGAASAAPPANDHYYYPADIEEFPFTAEVDLTEARRELREVFNDCLPRREYPNTPLHPQYADVWFRFTTTESHLMLALTENAPVPILGLFRPPSETEPDRMQCDAPRMDGDPALLSFWVYAGTYLLQVGACVNCGARPVVRLQVLNDVPSADLGVENLTVARPATPTPAGALPDPLTRRVEFDVANVAGAAARGNWHVQACHSHDYEGDYCIPVANGLTVPLAAGERAHIIVRWNAARSVGDFNMCATVSSIESLDPEWGNNRARADTWVLIGNIGFGESFGEEFSKCYT